MILLLETERERERERERKIEKETERSVGGLLSGCDRFLYGAVPSPEIAYSTAEVRRERKSEREREIDSGPDDFIRLVT